MKNRFAVLKIHSHDPDLQRRGRVLAIILALMLATTATLAIVNVVQGDTQYNRSNVIYSLIVVAFFALNRAGYVSTAALLTVMLVTTGSLLLLVENTDQGTRFIVMCIPILIASFLVVSWGGLVVAALLLSVEGIIQGFANEALPSLFALLFVALLAFMFSGSLNRAYLDTRYQALHDRLTGMPNRALFLDRLQHALDRANRDQSACAVLFMDLDDFKVVNDSLGHEAGDELLVDVSQRLQGCLRLGDTAARLGGDEFTLLLENISDVSDAVRVAERITEALASPVELRNQRIFVSTSTGIALATGANSQPGNLLRDADVAMYAAKKEGKGGYKLFNVSMHTRALRRLSLEDALRRALERQEFEVYYQPKVLVSTGEIVGMEALARWRHPKYGLIGPEEFIPLAEETGLILPIGQWVLREACRQTRAWQDQFSPIPHLVTSVNLSVKQFRQPDLTAMLAATLAETGLDPRYLQLEITESVVVDDIEYAVSLLHDLKSLNVELAIDDFGKGYSSLESLSRFPVDYLKIDRAFVKELGVRDQDAAIAKLVIELAHAVGMKAVGEGVETTEQLALLRELGCDLAQGFYFQEPLPSEAAMMSFAHPANGAGDNLP
ncbi:MAG: EAL domain-containing protein [Rubrobacter sp.]|nr:EAL domain-containing protein [Rubrobacter sp.]